MTNYDISVTLPDTKKLVDKLSRLPDKVQKKVAKGATRKAMAIVRRAAISNAKAFDDPATPEQIHKNVVVQEASRSSKRVGGVVMRVGVRGGARNFADTRENRRKGRVGQAYQTLGDKTNPGGDTWYWRFLEFGTSKMAARAFLRKAFSDNLQQVTDVTVQGLQKGLDKVVKEK